MREAFGEEGGAEYYLAVYPDGMFHPDALVQLIVAARRWDGRALVEAAQFPEELPKVFDPLTLDTPWASGACLLVPAAVYAAVGGFDENMFMGYEVVDLSWRARQAGYAVKHAPRALFHHRFNRPGTNRALRRARLHSARYLATKWRSEEFAREIERAMADEGLTPNQLPAASPAPAAPSVADFTNGQWFAPIRWVPPTPVPVHDVCRHENFDSTIDIVVRFHDASQIRRLSHCLFSLYGQLHQPIQVLLMLQGLDAEGVATVERCVDAFDWSSPRRRPLVTNVVVPPTGDHRARLWNAGLAVGGARYLGFCDFDDTVYSAGYSYLLSRLQYTGAAAAFASSLRVDCTPMRGFDFAFAKEIIPGEDRYDFFVGSFCPPNSILFDRSLITPADLRAEESLSKSEDYRAFAAVVVKYDTDWASIGTAVADYYQRTDGSNTVSHHRSDVANRREWDESWEGVRQFFSTLTTKVPVNDIVRMRAAERSLRHELIAARAALDRESSERRIMSGSLSWRLTSPFRKVKRAIGLLRMPQRSGG